jgi:small subunit ribosomal protein S18
VVIATPPPAAPAGTTTTTTRPTGPRRGPREFGTGRKFTPRRKVCAFCVDKIKEVDYKDLGRLRRFLSERGKIEPRRKTGTCAAHQRSLNVALKRARQLAMLPFTAEHIRVTGVLVREPGAPPFRGPRGPRPAEAVEGEASVEPGAEPAAEEVTGPPPSPESPETVAESSSAQGTSETPATGPTTPESE